MSAELREAGRFARHVGPQIARGIVKASALLLFVNAIVFAAVGFGS